MAIVIGYQNYFPSLVIIIILDDDAIIHWWNMRVKRELAPVQRFIQKENDYYSCETNALKKVLWYCTERNKT